MYEVARRYAFGITKLPEHMTNRNEKDYISASQAAAQLSVTRPTVVSWAAKGRLRSLTVAGLVYVHREDVARERDATQQAPEQRRAAS